VAVFVCIGRPEKRRFFYLPSRPRLHNAADVRAVVREQKP
jgi:hypothetical protein